MNKIYAGKTGSPMKKIFFAVFILTLTNISLRSQVVENSGKPLAEIYTDFHVNLSGGSKTTGFALNRAYFGYNYFATKTFSALIKVEIGNPAELAPGSISRRYAYYREASISYSKDKLHITGGITGTGLFEFQQNFWGKRYIANTFQSLNGYGFVADMGIIAYYKFNDKIKVDVSLMNGEGYSSVQLDKNLKPSLGFTITPRKGLALRIYSDLIRTEGLWQSTSIAFIGYKNEKINFGGEVNYKSNIDLNDGHNAWGISFTGAVNLTQNIEIFTRFDYSSFGFIPEAGSLFDLANEGIFIIPGLQFTLNKYVRIALDYQTTLPSNISKQNSNLIFLNSVFKF
jgi:hypothetical protein